MALDGVVAAVVAVGDTDCERPSSSEASLFIGACVNFEFFFSSPGRSHVFKGAQTIFFEDSP